MEKTWLVLPDEANAYPEHRSKKACGLIGTIFQISHFHVAEQE